MGCTDSRPVAAAGCFFTNGTHLLAGYQPDKRCGPIISGIGGSVKPEETWHQAAIREMLEELLEIHQIPDEFATEIGATVKFSHAFVSRKYTFMLYSFTDLEKILELCSTKGLASPAYPEGIPRTVADLLFKRDLTATKEVKQLVLLPLTEKITIDSGLQADVNDYLKYYNVL
jgi:hypothetical protein